MSMSRPRLLAPLVLLGFARLVLGSAPAVAANAEEMIGTGSLEVNEIEP